jgi:hypothetical protein
MPSKRQISPKHSILAARKHRQKRLSVSSEAGAEAEDNADGENGTEGNILPQVPCSQAVAVFVNAASRGDLATMKTIAGHQGQAWLSLDIRPRSDELNALHVAVICQQHSVAAWLIRCGANVRDRQKGSGRLVLHNACARSNAAMVDLLISQCAMLDLNEPSYDGMTALDYATQWDRRDISGLLKALGGRSGPAGVGCGEPGNKQIHDRESCSDRPAPASTSSSASASSSTSSLPFSSSSLPSSQSSSTTANWFSSAATVSLQISQLGSHLFSWALSNK